MSEPRKNHLSIDGAQVKEDEHVASYKPIPDSDTDFKTSKSNLSKSKEKVSPDGAEEKLLQKEDEAKVVRVDMADAKYVVGDQRNGDAKIELDSNKRQFSGLTKEELLKYADDPFWVNLRWCMFVLFWALWLGMLAGAIAIIVRAPKCWPPTPRTWYEKGPLVDMDVDFAAISQDDMKVLQSSKVEGIFVEVPTYDALDKPDMMQKFSDFVAELKNIGVKVIVDLTPNYVANTHSWFLQSENRSAEYSDFFIWRDFKEGGPSPMDWVSTLNESAWTKSEIRGEYYLHQYRSDQPDLNFKNEGVVSRFITVLEKWMKAGAGGVRLNKARSLIVNSSFAYEGIRTGRGSDPGSGHADHGFWQHRHTYDQPQLNQLFARFADAVDKNSASPGSGESVFTLKEDEPPELFMLDSGVSRVWLRPPSAAPLAAGDVAAAAALLNKYVAGRWPLLQLTADAEAAQELAYFALLLPAAPVFQFAQLEHAVNDTDSGRLSHLVPLRSDAGVGHGPYDIRAAPAAPADPAAPGGVVLVCARWKARHTGYVGVFNPSGELLRADLSAGREVPAGLTVYHVSRAVGLATNYTTNTAVSAGDVLVPAKSTVVLSYVPRSAEED